MDELTIALYAWIAMSILGLGATAVMLLAELRSGESATWLTAAKRPACFGNAFASSKSVNVRSFRPCLWAAFSLVPVRSLTATTVAT
ncbi:hypothetical protein EZ313_04695 [Ramlibacter henchirensis]|uniref:Uncharacterized protein n=1 Tax=Ramlibacter henchirensis TaxID=204072 RepID=A0A4Z0C793_9BURK|nr:hypothetical protein [Ramlibacter henchirensis]TFZ05955.1 hypothetical protein EZ313_04695 [Ramlibacter henchirensis]